MTVTEDQYFEAVLKDMGAPVTSTSLKVLETWSRGEKPAGDWSQWWNPLNTTQAKPGARSVNSVGVRSYMSAAQGEQATAQTIGNGLYPALATALRGGKGISAFQSTAVVTEVENRWGTKAYGSLIKSPNKATSSAPSKQASSGSGSGSGGGLDLNPLDWLDAASGAAGTAAGTAAGAALGAMFTAVADALGGVVKGVATTAQGSLVALGTALVVTLILVGPRQTQNIVRTVVNAAPAPAAAPPADAPEPPDSNLNLDAADTAYYQQQYREWRQEQKQAAKAGSGDYSFAGNPKSRGHSTGRKFARAAKDTGEVAGAAAVAA